MYFTTKSVSLFLIGVTASASNQADITARSVLAELSAVFFSNVNLTGASFSPSNLVQGVCNTLPCCWLDRAESILIGPGYACTFFVFLDMRAAKPISEKRIEYPYAVGARRQVRYFVGLREASLLF
ncbi:hypothetical protein GALMADRAFT_206211 [Galerina marginata CBS 339.88]|uniref:Hydrophobin n=1 Tax=Galerina marginata (strain CBS 339.88) TaxID=685588 RepID=A0A067TQU2_GALM3|nr:hypothetical protein GALMADRAFT_206211 [Galerina marginata CBS 339.88]